MSIFNLKNYLGGNESNKIYLGDKIITDVQLGGPDPVVTNPVTSGMVLGIEPGNPASYPGTGTTVTDISSYGNTATLGANITWNAAGYFTFDTNRVSTNSLVFGAGAQYGYSNEWSVVINWRPLTSTFSYIWEKQITGIDGGSGVYGYTGDAMRPWNGGYRGMTEVSSPLNVLNSIAFTKDANGVTNNYKSYKNGVLQQQLSSDFSVNASTTGFQINIQAAQESMEIYNFYVYNRALTSAEITTIESFINPGDVDANAYISAVTNAGGTLSAGEETAIQTLFTETKAAGVYSKLDCFYPMMGGTQASHAINANGDTTYDLSFNGTWVFDATGSTPNGTNAWADTSKVISAGEISNSCFGMYTANSGSNQSSYSIDSGVYNGTETWYLAQKWTSTGDSRGGNQLNTSVAMAAVNGGLMVNVRSAVDDFKIYQNQVLAATDTATAGAVDSGIYSCYVGARNDAGSASFYSSAPHSFDFFANQSLSLTEINDYSTAIQTLMTTLSRNAY